MQFTWQQSIGIDESHLQETQDNLGNTVLVNKIIIDDLRKLMEAAEQNGHSMCIISGFRSFAKQLSIWNDKWQGYRPVYSRHGRPLNIMSMSDIEKYKAISLWSALPGMSRHHWGTDLDIFLAAPVKKGYCVELTPEEFADGGPCAELSHWLDKNLEKFGFFRPYKDYKGGVSEEPWHISHHKTSSQIAHEFDFQACFKYIASSDIKASRFIANQLEHYRDSYFNNICNAQYLTS